MIINLNLREDIQKNFPNFEYFNIESRKVDFSREDNLTGDQQEAFIYYWLFKKMKESPDGFCSLDIGCGQNIHFPSIGLDFYSGIKHPVYSGEYRPQITSLAENIAYLNKNTFSVVICSHILEHVKDPITTFRKWVKLLKKGGIIIVLLPDAIYEKGIKWDPSHINFFTPESFKEKIINTNLDLLRTEIFDDLHNRFSISYVGRRI